MGFYSIYKIVKDIFRTIFGNKALKLIFIILTCILIFMFLYDKGVFAYSAKGYVDYTYNDTNFHVPIYHENKGYILVVNSDGTPWRCFFTAMYDTKNTYRFYDSTNKIGNLATNNSNGWYCTYNYSNGVYTLSNSEHSYTGQASLGDNRYILYSNYDIYLNGTNDIYLTANTINPVFLFIEPYFVTTEQNIQDWNFDFLEISGGDVPYYTTSGGTSPIFGDTYLELILTYNYVNYDIDISQFIVPDYDNNTWSIKIPKNYLFNYVNVQNGIDFKFTLYAEQQYPFQQYTIETDNMTFNLTAEQLAEINNDTDKQMQGTIVQQQQEIVQGQQDLNNSINNSNIDDITSNTLPSDSTTDITADGVNGIFTSIYNAFCTGEAQDIVFPIPFTDKSITLSPNYISNALTNCGATFIITIIQAFWWYLISRFIIKDIMNKINKIKSGNIEDIETNNIRGDML